MKLNKKQKRFVELGSVILISIISFLFWNSIIVYPIKLFVVLLHELSHGFAAIITGGTIHSVEINEFLGGKSLTSDGNTFAIASAGYLGSQIIGALLFISAYNKRVALWTCSIIPIVLIVSAANIITGGIGVFVAVAFAVIIFTSPRFLPGLLNKILLKTLGLISVLYVFIDIKEDLITLEYRPSDTQVLADISSIPSLIWGFLWLLISAIIIFYLFKYSFKKGL